MQIAKRGSFIVIGNRFIQIANIDMLVNDGYMIKMHLSGGYNTHISPDSSGEITAETKKLYDKIIEELYDQP